MHDEAARQLRSKILLLDRLLPRAGRRLRRSPLRSRVVAVRHRGIQPTDVILGAYPRSGSTWLRLMLSHLVSGGDVGLRASEFIVPMIGFKGPSVGTRPGARILRSHEPYRPVYRRAIYLVRDVRDVAVSYLELNRAAARWRGDRQAFLLAFVAGEIDGYGAWQDHVQSWLQADIPADVLVVRYEDLLSVTHRTLRTIADFSGIAASDALIDDAVRANSADQVRLKEGADEAFLRELGWRIEQGTRVRAVSGGWRSQLGPDELTILARCNPALRAAGYEPLTDHLRGSARLGAPEVGL